MNRTDQTDQPRTTFLTVALAARSRGFTWVAPVDDKAVCRKSWLKFNITKTETDLRLMAAEFPHHEVGIVLKGNAGSVFVWDIDKPGVLDRMKRDGIELPATYIVQSRPKTAPYKMHIYFKQTPYFASLFPRQVNAGDYDLKGMGGGQVVAEGCVRKDTGEIRVGNGLPICDVPNDIADWLKRDSAPLVAEIKQKQREAARTIVPGAPVIRSQRTLFLNNIASRLFEQGLSRGLILAAITERCRDECQGGIAWANSPDGERKLKTIANNSSFRRKRVNPVYTASHPQNRKSTFPIIQVVKTQDPRRRRKALLVAEVNRLPNSITATEAYRRLGLDSSNRADQHRLVRAMVAGGFEFDPRGKQRGDRLWVRLLTTQNNTQVGSE
jgi:hypothetical protein